MKQKMSRVVVGFAVAGLAVAGLLPMFSSSDSQSVAVAADAASDAEPAPPAGQTYIGSKRCASCHFEQFLKWRKTPHANAYEVLTAKYQSDAKCLQCHTTGFGEESGFTDFASTPSLAGVSCETCHGPGSKHEEIAKPFAQTKDLTPQQEAMIRDSIWLMTPKNICVECHKTQAHGESQTPPELRKS